MKARTINEGIVRIGTHKGMSRAKKLPARFAGSYRTSSPDKDHSAPVWIAFRIDLDDGRTVDVQLSPKEAYRLVRAMTQTVGTEVIAAEERVSD